MQFYGIYRWDFALAYTDDIRYRVFQDPENLHNTVL